MGLAGFGEVFGSRFSGDAVLRGAVFSYRAACLVVVFGLR